MSGNGARAGLLLQPLRSRSFRLYWLGQATSAYGAADAFFWPAKVAIVPELVVRDHLMPAKEACALPRRPT